MKQEQIKKSNSRSALTLRIPTELRWKVQELAAQSRKRSLNAFIIDLLEKVVNTDNATARP